MIPVRQLRLPLCHNIIVSPPKNRVQYRLEESIKEYKGCAAKFKVMKHWLKNKYIPCSKSNFFRYVHPNYNYGTTPTLWKMSPGRSPIINAKIIVKMTFTLSVGRVTSSIYIHSMLEKEALENAIRKTWLSTVLSPPTISRITVANYKALASVSSKAKFLNNVQQKTENCHTAENFVMSTISFLLTVTTTYPFVGEKDSKLHSRKKKSITVAQKLTRLISKCNNNTPIFAVLPGLSFSADDITIFVFRGNARYEGSCLFLQEWRHVHE